MVIEKVKIGSITLDPTNARRHDEENIESLKRSLVSFGQQKPIVVNKSGVVVAGNGFLSAALALGWKHVMVVRTDLTPELAQAYAVADNRLSELSQWDTDALNTILQSLPPELVLATGWDEEDLKHLLGGVIDAYTPILAPEFGAAQINDSDLKKAEGVFAVAQTIGAKIAVTCPHCGEDFEIDPQS